MYFSRLLPRVADYLLPTISVFSAASPVFDYHYRSYYFFYVSFAFFLSISSTCPSLFFFDANLENLFKNLDPEVAGLEC